MRSAGKKIFVGPLHFFGSASTINRFGDRFRDGEYSLASCCSSIHVYTVPSGAQPFVKVGGRALRCPMKSAPLWT